MYDVSVHMIIGITGASSVGSLVSFAVQLNSFVSKSYEQYRHINNRLLSIGVRSSSSLSTGYPRFVQPPPVWHWVLVDVVKRYVLCQNFVSSVKFYFFSLFFLCNLRTIARSNVTWCIFATNIVKTLFLNTTFRLLPDIRWRFQKMSRVSDVRSTWCTRLVRINYI